MAKPDYDRSRVRIGVVHLGIGAFHRAHQAIVFDDALNAGDLRWGVLGASLRSPDVRDQLAPQDGLYTMVIEDGGQRSLRIVGAVQEVRVALRDPASLVEAMASPEVHIVTLTVTEKGYCLDPASGKLKLDDPGISADLADLSAPVTAPGFVTAALRLRRNRGLSPFTVISCDNLPHNGARIRSAVLEMAARIDPRLHDWIAAEGAFPQTMIDRIVPATTPADIEILSTELGFVDLGMVKTEPFTQWIIEDRFAGERPDFARFKVRLTEAVGPWEDAKLRLLNGAHSTLAYLGALAGLEYVHQTVAVPVLKAFVDRLWDEAEATLDPPPGLDIAAYRAELMARFSNAALRHRTRQIAMDGSQKLPQRLLATASARLSAGLPIPALALGIAAWIRWQEGRTEAGEVVVVEDPLASETARRLTAATDDRARVAALLDLQTVFQPALSADPVFREAVMEAFVDLRRLGAVGAAALRLDRAA
ncbi:mannitol dehydrogenase family protein [Brevundimonas sp. SL161]|uniref:mannitol dehydrogenase family protein n=1 Tax=Brevundimonas sp. SL161 TaxID=2804613 RepID=UPI003CF198B8